jgi:phosphoglycolate phosphatase
MLTIRTHFRPRPEISHVIFDFDGTLSWLRHGWPGLMCELLLEHIPLQRGESREQLRQSLLERILSLNGKPSVIQMQLCVEQAEKRGSPKPDRENLLLEYHHRLERMIQERTKLIHESKAQRDDFIVHGGRAFIEELRERDLNLIILSGTIERQVKQEADLLDLSRYFGQHIYGGTPDLAQSSKRLVIERLMLEQRISGQQLLAFGDGALEIGLTKAAGGLAVGVASDEEQNGSGQMHPVKLKQLGDAGADLLIPDYRDPDALLECLLGK